VNVSSGTVKTRWHWNQCFP